ncbi:alanine racemase [Sphaerisporangium sp. NPDC005289]|uniref:alanine racemase n=1 Tax=Sphaerisporangium sp. NPDC005289 TaxID=3155247 RepID=UPI0033BE2883
MGIDEEKVRALRDEPLDWRYKALPAGAGGTVAQFLAGGPSLQDFGTPLLTLDAAALEHNIAVMACWAAGAGVTLMPHGKSTMAPELWRRQLAAGAWGLTLANFPQMRVARAFGVARLMLAAAPVDPAGLAWIGRELDRDPAFRFICWADSVEAVQIMDAALRGTRRPVEVCVELGGPGGRTGARGLGAARRVAEAVRAAPALRLAGVAGYEGSFAHDASPEGLAAVRGYLQGLAELFGGLAFETGEPIVTAGGSAYFDQVADVLGGLEARLVLRSGAYVIHDDGFYRAISPFRLRDASTTSGPAGNGDHPGAGPGRTCAAEPPGSGPGRACAAEPSEAGPGRACGADPPGTGEQAPAGEPFRAAMHGWARVISRPEPGLALLDAGKRDLPFDEGLPEPQHVRGKGPLHGARVTALNDQHTHLAVDPACDLACGDVVRFGLSHPCTAMDKWTLIPVIDGEAVVGLLRTFF